MKVYTQGMAVRYTRKDNAQLPFGTIGTYHNDLGDFAYVVWDNGINCQVLYTDIERVVTEQPGVLLESKPDRTMIAAMAMQGLLAKSDWGRSADDWDEYLLRISHASCELADALIEQLNKTEK